MDCKTMVKLHISIKLRAVEELTLVNYVAEKNNSLLASNPLLFLWSSVEIQDQLWKNSKSCSDFFDADLKYCSNKLSNLPNTLRRTEYAEVVH